MTRYTHARRTSGPAGFTLIEVLICSVLLALGFIALVAAFGHDSVVAQRGEDITRATFLADEIRDMAFQMSFSAFLGLNGTTYNPAILSNGSSAGLTGWSQAITVTPVSKTDLNSTVSPTGAEAARLTVEVRQYGTPVIKQTYYNFNMSGVPFTDGTG